MTKTASIKAIRAAIMRRHPDVFPCAVDEREILSETPERSKVFPQLPSPPPIRRRPPRCGCGGEIIWDYMKRGYRCCGCGKFLSEQAILLED